MIRINKYACELYKLVSYCNRRFLSVIYYLTMKDVIGACIFFSIAVTQGLGLMCLQCVNVIQPRHCHGITYCADNEVCYGGKIISTDGIRYNSGCMEKGICKVQNSSSTTLTTGDGLIQTYACTDCCQSDLCNSEGCGEPGIPSTRGPMCFGCSQIRNATDCRTITYCRQTEVCHITEEVEFGDKVYSTGCVHSQLCSSVASRQNAISDLSSWHTFTRASTVASTSMSTTTSQAQTTTFPTSSRKTHTHATHTKHTTKQAVTPPMGVVVVGRRLALHKRYVDCSQCCHGDLCECHRLDKATTPSSSKSTAYLPTIHPTQIFHPSSSIQNTWQQSSPTTQATMQQSSSTTQGISNFTIPTAGTVPLTSTISPTSSQTQNNGPDSTGQEFLLAFSKHENGNDADNISLLVTSPENGHISIYIPENNAYINKTLTKGENIIGLDPHLTVDNLQKENKSVHVLTDVNVTLHVQEYRNVFDTGFLALPTHCMSTKYIVSTEPAFDGANPAYVTVAALKDNTDLSFKLKLSGNDTIEFKGRQYGDGDFLNISLGRYETFQIAGLTDFTGTIVQSSNPVSVLSGNTATVVPKPVDPSNIFDAQTLSQMMPSVPSLGKQFIVPKLQDRHSFYYKIIASSPNTHVTVGNRDITLQNEGSFQTLESFNGRSVNISSDKPVLVVQVAKTMQSHYDTASGAMIVTPSVEQYRSDYDVIIPDPPKRNLQTKYRTYLTIITNSSEVDNINIDGKKYDAFNSNLQTVHLNGKSYSVISLEMDDPGLHKVNSSSGSKFGLITYGFDYAQGYGYPVGLKC